MSGVFGFLRGCVRQVLTGGRAYKLWMAFLLATVLVCLLTWVMGGIQVYLGQLIWPDWSSYPDVDTAFVHVAGRAGGPFPRLGRCRLVPDRHPPSSTPSTWKAVYSRCSMARC